MRLVIVESPTKAKTIEKFLGQGYRVASSFGHVRDLPNKAAEVPDKIKKDHKEWARLGVAVDQDFEPLYVIPDSKKKRVSELKQLLKDADALLLATDEDREGESISWHLVEVLQPKVPVERLVFHEITRTAIERSLKNTREIDFDLVKAQETRRIIDRLFGYSVSPLLWKKIGPKLSAGRVQSVAMRLLVQRERERIAFKGSVYWDLQAQFNKLGSPGGSFSAELTQLDGQRVATGRDFDPATGALRSGSKVVALDSEMAKALCQELQSETARVLEVQAKPFTQRPYAPFTTSTLQQEASRKLSFSAKHTMAVAQTLYENGVITYMRTDSTTLSEEAVVGARELIERDFGRQFLPATPRSYQTKVKNAQEAHEAIRPAGSNFVPMEDVKRRYGVEAFRLYELIWKRTVASQMKDAHGTRVTAQIVVGRAVFRAAGKTIEFPGFLRAYVEGADDPEAELADQERILPPLVVDEELKLNKAEALEHSTKPPARYTEGSLIKELESLGIGRPSTWATIVDIVLSRTYAFKKGSTLIPTYLAMALTTLMERYFTQLVDYSFTASMEDDLDAISRGEADNLAYLKQFYFGNGHPGLRGLVELGEEKIDPREINGIPIGTDTAGRPVEVRIGRYGPFISNGETRASVPDLLPPDELTPERALELLADAERGPQSIGVDPDSGLPVYVKTGRYGPYVQLGDADGDDKPKMASLLAGMDPAKVELEIALKLLSLPRNLGQHPELKEEVVAANGRYGPYVKCGSETRSISGDQTTPIDITLDEALALLREPKRRRRSGASTSLRELGKHPVTELPLVVKSGRYGPYVTDGELNASLPRGLEVEALTMEDAVNLLEARAAKVAAGGGPVKSKTKSKTKTKAKSKEKAKTKSKTKTSSKSKAKTKAKKSSNTK